METWKAGFQTSNLSPEKVKHLHFEFILLCTKRIQKSVEELNENCKIYKALGSLDNLISTQKRTGVPAWRPSGDPEKDIEDHLKAELLVFLGDCDKTIQRLEKEKQEKYNELEKHYSSN